MKAKDLIEILKKYEDYDLHFVSYMDSYNHIELQDVGYSEEVIQLELSMKGVKNEG